MLGEYDVVIPPEYEPVGNAARKIHKDILTVRPERSIYINTAHAHPGIYSDPEILKALRFVHKNRRVSIRALVSPIIIADHQVNNGLLVLRDEGVLDLRVRSTRRYGYDFNVIEGTKSYTYHQEQIGDSLLPPDGRKIRNYDYFTSWQWQGMAAEDVRIFKGDFEKARVSGDLTSFVPALATEIDLHEIVEILESHSAGSFYNWTIAQMLEVPGVRERLISH